MDFEKIAQYDDGKGLDLISTILALQNRKLDELSQQEMDELLIHSEAWKNQKEMFPARCGPFIAYEQPGVPFGKEIKSDGLTVLVPHKFQGKKDISLVAYTKDLTIKGKVISSARFEAFDLPINDNWYDTDSKYGLPVGEPKEYSEERRHLYRWQDRSWVGLVVRFYGVWGDYDWRDVYCYFDASSRYGVLGKSRSKKNAGKTPDLKQLAREAEKSVKRMDGVVKKELLTPIEMLVEAAKR